MTTLLLGIVIWIAGDRIGQWGVAALDEGTEASRLIGERRISVGGAGATLGCLLTMYGVIDWLFY